MTQIATFELEISVIDKPTERRRWNGGPLASKEANNALHDALDAFQAVLLEEGLEIIHTGYGVRARETDA